MTDEPLARAARTYLTQRRRYPLNACRLAGNAIGAHSPSSPTIATLDRTSALAASCASVNLRARRATMLARRFLYIVAALIFLVVAAGLVWTLLQDRLIRMAFVPGVAFKPLTDATAPDYARPEAWVARPGKVDDPARWTPPDLKPTDEPKVAVFFIAPTTYLSRSQWNGPLDDAAANGRLDLFVRSQASAFNGVGAIWAPRYRQATLGAFLAAGDPRSVQAIDFAFRDVERAFDTFIKAVPANGPIILAGHSQGSLHLLRLLRERISGRPLAQRVVAAYAIGWPISTTADVPALGLPACARAEDAGCVAGWQSFAEPAAPRLIEAYFEASTGPTGLPRKGTPMLCTNPLTGTAGGAAPPAKNLGALVPRPGLAGADLTPRLIPARCTEQGVLLIGPPPTEFGTYVLPGNNYHVFDYALFWANVRADAATRLQAFLNRGPKAGTVSHARRGA